MDLKYPILMDGATGTELQKLGMPAGSATALWAAEHPEAIRAVHEGYLKAGSNFLIVATFGANAAALSAHKASHRVAELNTTLVRIAREAAGDRAIVAGDLSPTGWLCAPLGDHDFEEIVEVYREQAEALEAAGVDCYLIETQMALSDIRAAMLAVRRVSDKPILVSVTADGNGRLPYGSDMTACLITAQAMGAVTFGLNCSFGPDLMAENLLKLAPYAKVPLSSKANAGMPQSIDGMTVYDCPVEAYTDPLPALYEAGVRLFGGCCGSTPTHIAALHEALQSMEPGPITPAEGEWLASEQKVYPLPSRELPVVTWDEAEDADVPSAILLDADCLENLIDTYPLLDIPLCLRCDDAAVLEQALRAYQGRAAYAGGGLSADALAPLVEKYGLLVL